MEKPHDPGCSPRWRTGAGLLQSVAVTRPALVALTALLFLGIPLAGCGGEGARAPAATPAAVTVDELPGTARVTDPARAAYIRRADRVCADLDPKREGKLREVEGSEDPAGT